MIRVGEKGGNLEEVLKILSQYLKKEHDFRTKIKGAMVYPAVIVVAMIIIGVVMMVSVVPKITSMFKELHATLPFTTRIVIAISDFLSNYFIIGVIAFFVLLVAFIKFLRTKQGKYLSSWLFLKFPFLGKITQKINCARFARSFSSLMESGVPIIESLTITAQTVGNVFYSNSLIEVAVEVKKGKNIQESLEKHKEIYPILVSQMIGVGEQTGELSEIMVRLADFYEEEVTNITNNLASIIEPVLMIIIGAIVGFFAVSMIQPMYSMMQAL
jgi:type IV pilus assembly protein PilC